MPENPIDDVLFLNQPRMDYSACFDFVALNGKSGTFDLAVCEYVRYGQADREAEMLCRIPGRRWVLLFMVLPGHEDDDGPHPVDRELAPTEAACWLRLNRYAPPADLELASPDNVAEHSIGPPSRVDRDWESPSAEPLNASAVATAQVPGSGVRNDDDGTGSARPSTADRPRLGRERNTLENLAVVLLLRHPDWTNVQIAAELGCHPKSLSRFPRFQTARRMAASAKNDLPRSQKDGKTGHMEAYEN